MAEAQSTESQFDNDKDCRIVIKFGYTNYKVNQTKDVASPQ